jgi:hypothetical protein
MWPTLSNWNTVPLRNVVCTYHQVGRLPTDQCSLPVFTRHHSLKQLYLGTSCLCNLVGRHSRMNPHCSNTYLHDGKDSHCTPVTWRLLWKSDSRAVDFKELRFGIAMLTLSYTLERFQSKVLRMIVDAPWYVHNSPQLPYSQRRNPLLQLSLWWSTSRPSQSSRSKPSLAAWQQTPSPVSAYLSAWQILVKFSSL